ncbi:MAG: hypothetical protein EOP53_21065, partial [Sphingobacteriales bacterium]
MKAALFVFAFIFFGLPGYTQVDTSSFAKVVFIRDLFNSNLKNYKLLVDRKFLCSIEERRYTIHLLQPGVHSFSAQIGGKKSKEKAEQLEIEMTAG